MITSLGTERLGESSPRGWQARIKELNEREPLMRCREVATPSQKLQDGALRKCLEDIFSDRASWRGGNTELKVIVAILLITEINGSHLFYGD